MNNKPIGVFDSGIGGLSCIPALAKELPNEQIIYYGDSIRAPYGTRPKEEIVKFSVEIGEKLIAMGCKSLSIACNTISCNAIDELRNAFPNVPVIGIVEPAKEMIIRLYPDKRIGVIATPATIKSGAYSSVCVCSKSCPDFVTMVESGIINKEVIRKNLDSFIAENRLDVLVLGCTHFPFIKREINELYPELLVFDPAQALAVQTKNTLESKSMLSEHKAAPNKYINTLESATFNRIIKQYEV